MRCKRGHHLIDKHMTEDIRLPFERCSIDRALDPHHDLDASVTN